MNKFVYALLCFAGLLVLGPIGLIIVLLCILAYHNLRKN